MSDHTADPPTTQEAIFADRRSGDDRRYHRLRAMARAVDRRRRSSDRRMATKYGQFDCWWLKRKYLDR